ncbi:MAG: sigma-54-dependent Fis family transcriptional regulator [Ignavibacteriales bacterium]|nr:sigma-54-dependent Fis family transcriptional regulator [Ignavibacteriales bacterium]
MESILIYNVNNESYDEIEQKLKSADISVQSVSSLDQAVDALRSKKFTACILRWSDSKQADESIVDFVLNENIKTKLIVSTGDGSVDEAVHFMKSGVIDYIVGDMNDPRLIETIIKLNENFPDQKESNPVCTTEQGLNDHLILVGKSAAISEIRSAIRLVAKSQTTVLVTGESGTGKEVVARLIHSNSQRSQNQFHALNCTTLPKDVIENELFGHEKGAFTGALQKKAGCFELADGGTLLFDEIAEMSLETQAKLLRAIETQKFRRLGGKDEINVNVRMIAATNKNIADALKSKELREDLYYRLSVIEIYIPPLRERREDIPLLVDHFLKIFAAKYEKPLQRFTEDAMALLLSYDWPGNIRELRNVVERALVICQNDKISPHYLPQRLHQSPAMAVNINIPLGCTMHEAERILFLQTLASTGNNKAKAAKILGVSRKTLHNKLSNYQLM